MQARHDQRRERRSLRFGLIRAKPGKKIGVFFLVFCVCVFVLLGGVLFGGVCCFSRVSAIFFRFFPRCCSNYFFALSQAKPGISALPEALGLRRLEIERSAHGHAPRHHTPGRQVAGCFFQIITFFKTHFPRSEFRSSLRMPDANPSPARLGGSMRRSASCYKPQRKKYAFLYARFFTCSRRFR